MSKKNIREESANGRNNYGIYITLSDPTVVEMAAAAGYDFARIDCEHYLFNSETLLSMISLANLVSLPVFVRVSSLNEITKVLEAGADGVIVPHVSTRDDAINAVKMTKFFPLGERGMYNGYRCTRYGQIDAQGYVKGANENVLLTIQIEDKEGVSNIDEILSVPGIDMVSSGKADLSQSLGYLGQSNHPEVLKAEEQIVKKALEYKVQPSLLVGNEDRCRYLQELGVHSFTIARDRNLLISNMKYAAGNYNK